MRLAVPSWVIPGTYAENLRFLEPKKAITAVELLFFLYDSEVRSLLDAEWEAISAFKSRFAFSAHLPDRIKSEHEELVARLSPLVTHFVVHPWPAEEAGDFSALLDSWIDRYDPEAGSTGAHRFLLENTQGGRFEAALPRLPRVGICLDTGHRLLGGEDPAEAAALWKNRIEEVHLHAVDKEAAALDGRLADHRSLRGEETWLEALAPFLRSFNGTIDLEVFSWAEAETSLRALGTRGLGPERK